MLRLPVMKIDPKAPNVFPASLMPRIYKAKKVFGFAWGEERRIDEFGYPIHFMRIRQVKCDLNILIGVLHYDQAVVVDVRVRPVAFEENRAPLLHLGRVQVSLFEK